MKIKSILLSTLFIVTAMLLIGNCGGGNTNPASDSPNVFTSSNPMPSGVTATLDGDGVGCPYDSTFPISITVTNNTASSKIITIPAGTRYLPGDNSYQPLMTIEPIVITIAASSSDTFCLPMFCLDVNAESPEGGIPYINPNIIVSGCLKDIIDALAEVNIASLTFADILQIQEIIWECTDPDSEVTQEEWNWLNSL
jgi:hypothetical protein